MTNALDPWQYSGKLSAAQSCARSQANLKAAAGGDESSQFGGDHPQALVGCQIKYFLPIGHAFGISRRQGYFGLAGHFFPDARRRRFQTAGQFCDNRSASRASQASEDSLNRHSQRARRSNSALRMVNFSIARATVSGVQPRACFTSFRAPESTVASSTAFFRIFSFEPLQSSSSRSCPKVHDDPVRSRFVTEKGWGKCVR